MPSNPETGESYKNDEEALRAAGVEDAEAVLAKLEESGYKLEVSDSYSEEVEEETAPAAEEETSEGMELEPGGSTDMAEEEDAGMSMVMMGEDEPMSKKRDAVAEGLMDKFKMNMV